MPSSSMGLLLFQAIQRNRQLLQLKLIPTGTFLRTSEERCWCSCSGPCAQLWLPSKACGP